ncbi:unannotated protein [freshwater metagenome]|uniref:Unannotated protein n=1 Tax=freshwater metagenome TaxID=449393 RepID=A0A6J6SEG3_9ZZZZ
MIPPFDRSEATKPIVAPLFCAFAPTAGGVNPDLAERLFATYVFAVAITSAAEAWLATTTVEATSARLTEAIMPSLAFFFIYFPFP